MRRATCQGEFTQRGATQRGWRLHGGRPTLWRAALLVIAGLAATVAVAALQAAVAPSHTDAQAADGCDETAPIACLQPPATGAEIRCRPVPAPARPPDPDAPAAPALSCPVGEIVAAINRANVAYERAVRTTAPDDLADAWADTALANLAAWVEMLRARDLYATPVLHAIVLERLDVILGVATAQTVEHWTYVERDRSTGAVNFEHSATTRNVYQVHRRDRWVIVRVTATAAEP